jgi:arylsulfatase A-like enzyme
MSIRLSLWAAGLLCGLLASCKALQTKSPNLILMVLDDVGWSDVSYHGSDFPTPAIDQLATVEGVRLEQYYVQEVCSPTRSALMTGWVHF